MSARLAAVCLLSAAATPALAAPALAPLLALEKAGARVSALVVRLDDEHIIASVSPDEPLTPASVSKLYLAAASLQHLGPEFRFRTRLLAQGKLHNGILDGDLVLAGVGDPALTNNELWRLAAHAAEAGLRRVTGNLVVNTSFFGKLRCSVSDRCDASEGRGQAYDAPLSAAAVDFSTTAVAVIPASVPGRPARLALEPFALPMLELEGRVATVARNEPWRINVSRSLHDGRDVLTVSGSAPAGSAPRRFYRAVSNADRFAGETLRAFLAQAGITVAGGLQVESAKPPRGIRIARVEGQPLWILVRRMLVWSNNFMADTLALDLLREVQAPPLSVTAAGAALTSEARELERTSPLMRGRKPRVQLLSGSGLTPASRTSARDVVALLDALYHRSGLLPSFLGSLTVPAYTPVQMLKADGDRVWMTRIAAKTGSLTQPHSVFALAGYARLTGGRWAAFAVLINGTSRCEVPLDDAVDATRRALTPLLSPPPLPVPSGAGRGTERRHASDPRNADR